MRSPRRPVVACLAALSLVVAGGCGSGTNTTNDYVAAINKVQQDFANNVQKVRAEPAGNDPAAAAKKTFRGLKTAIDKAVVELRGVKPPDKVKNLHKELVGEMGQFETQVKTAGDSLSSKDPRKIRAAQSKFAARSRSLGTRIAKTIDAINRKLRG